MEVYELGTMDFVQLIIASLLIILSLIILKKSFDSVNIYFSITPIFFAITIFLTIIDNMIAIPSWISTVFYLIAPLGILISAWIIKDGTNYLRVPINMVFLLFYFLYSIISTSVEMIYVDPNSSLVDLFLDLNHVMVAVPMFFTAIYYYSFMKLVPEQKTKMVVITVGTLIIVLGLLIRAISYFQLNQESLIGLTVILVGTFAVLYSFLFLGKTD